MLDTLFRRKKSALKEGKWKEFNKHAVLISEGCYVNNTKDGVWKEYYDSGELMIEETFQNGVLHGHFASYHRNGNLLSVGAYVNGSREGYFRIHDEEGVYIKSLLFSNNNLVEGTEETTDENYEKHTKIQC